MLKTLALNIAVVLCAGLSLSPCLSLAQSKNQQPYGFYPSSKGESFKTLQHTIFGISIDVPKNWTFGISGSPPTAVILLYPAELDTRKISPQLEMIELGLLPGQIASIRDAQQYTMIGLQAAHPNSKVVEQPKDSMIAGNPAVKWVYQWQSKTGHTVTEYITLIQDKYRIRSVCVRTARPDFDSKRKFYEELIGTVKFTQPKI